MSRHYTFNHTKKVEPLEAEKEQKKQDTGVEFEDTLVALEELGMS